MIRFVSIAMLFALAAFSRAAEKGQSYALTGTQDLVEQKVKVEPVEYKGRKAVRVTKESFDEGFALVKGMDFQDGTIEADIALRVTTVPPGGRMPGFTGIAFRARADASHYELFYLRPGNSQSENQVMHNHSVQYTATPDFGWYELRRAWPWAYEAYADLQLENVDQSEDRSDWAFRPLVLEWIGEAEPDRGRDERRGPPWRYRAVDFPRERVVLFESPHHSGLASAAQERRRGRRHVAMATSSSP